jgi:hypothetical protein
MHSKTLLTTVFSILYLEVANNYLPVEILIQCIINTRSFIKVKIYQINGYKIINTNLFLNFPGIR